MIRNPYHKRSIHDGEDINLTQTERGDTMTIRADEVNASRKVIVTPIRKRSRVANEDARTRTNELSKEARDFVDLMNKDNSKEKEAEDDEDDLSIEDVDEIRSSNLPINLMSSHTSFHIERLRGALEVIWTIQADGSSGFTEPLRKHILKESQQWKPYNIIGIACRRGEDGQPLFKEGGKFKEYYFLRYDRVNDNNKRYAVCHAMSEFLNATNPSRFKMSSSEKRYGVDESTFDLTEDVRNDRPCWDERLLDKDVVAILKSISMNGVGKRWYGSNVNRAALYFKQPYSAFAQQNLGYPASL